MHSIFTIDILLRNFSKMLQTVDGTLVESNDFSLRIEEYGNMGRGVNQMTKVFLLLDDCFFGRSPPDCLLNLVGKLSIECSCVVSFLKIEISTGIECFNCHILSVFFGKNDEWNV